MKRAAMVSAKRTTMLQSPRLLAVFLCLLAFPNPGHGGNWPSFRGPNGSGVGTGDPPIAWNVETGENVKWKTRIPGLAHSSPIVWEDRAYLTTAVPVAGEAGFSTGWLQGTGDSAQDPAEWEWKVLALDKKTGKTIWERTAHQGAPKFKRHVKATHANCTPATDGKHVVAFFASEGLYAYDVDGKLLWKKDLGPMNAAPGDAPDLQWGVAGSPILHDGKVILQCDYVGGSYWIALDVRDGREILRVERGDDSTWCTPTLHVGKERTQVICNGYKKMAGYDLASGKELWWLNGGGDVPVPRPVVSENLIFLTNGHGRKPIYVIRPDATGDLTPGEEGTPAGLAWWNRVKGSYMPTPIVVDDILFVADDNGVLTAFEAASGTQLFRERIPGGGKSTYSASPVSAGGRLYITSEEGQVDVIAVAREYKHIASNKMGEVCMATPAVSDGLLLVRGRDHLFCIGK